MSVDYRDFLDYDSSILPSAEEIRNAKEFANQLAWKEFAQRLEYELAKRTPERTALLKRAEAMVTALEWAGRGRDGESTNTFFSGAAECPVCGNEQAGRRLRADVRGHRSNCELAKLQDDLRREIGLPAG